MIRLRYRLIPYIYSLAGEGHARKLYHEPVVAFDFADDARVHDIKDESCLVRLFWCVP